MMKEIFKLQSQVSDLVGVNTYSQTVFATVASSLKFEDFNNLLSNEEKQNELVSFFTDMYLF